MPKLNQASIEKVVIETGDPNDPLVVEIETTLTAGQALSISDNEDKSAAMIELLSSAIKSWNYTDDEGTAVPITAEAIAKMPVEAFTEVAKKLTDALGTTLSVSAMEQDEKKTDPGRVRTDRRSGVESADKSQIRPAPLASHLQR